MNAKNCAEIAVNLEYVKKISSIRYRFNDDDITRPKRGDKAKQEDQVKNASGYKTMSRT